MTEACEAVTDFWFSVLDHPVLRALRAAENIGSRRIAEKTGMRLIGTKMKMFVCGPMLAELWEITRDEWLARQRRG